ncbi:ATP-dependent DNA ligase [Asanoa sp. WMMD1127]|uniref:ATP-dependent DNA ligase n=1 Tax=Asanoa sp. WMMD1127 TaxID=3016107 RepID=UPI002417CA48|nr:ATP-dependent DNA ligase [Asanoa sp. WMMD1127]MDG4825599.1 ATP-dependent DNA ligase [Asanoa sp. WMMD1127]
MAAERDRASLRYPLAPMVATSVPELPVGPGWAYEPKWDGWRQVAWVRDGRVQLQTRNGHPIGLQFPDITRALRETVPAGTVLDGELVVWDEDRERSSFALLQRRAAAGRHALRLAHRYPAHFVVFDLLATPEQSLLPAPLAERRQHLERLLADVPNQLVLCPHTTSPAVAREWIDTWTSTGIEGVVAKRRDQRYRAGRGGWRKLRVRTTAEAVIGGVTGWPSAPQTVLVGRFDAGGRLRYLGRSLPLTDEQRVELAPLLSPPAARRRGAPVAHPWPQPLPAAWSGSWQRPEPQRYAQVEPEVVAELLVDTAVDQGRYRHPVHYVRPRRDLSVYDVPLLGVED